jgi:hypothetical protein
LDLEEQIRQNIQLMIREEMKDSKPIMTAKNRRDLQLERIRNYLREIGAIE